MKQYGFFIDISRCTGCKTCTLACKDYKELGPNQNFRRVYEYTGGNWKKEGETWRPDVFAYYVSMACNHCEDPACIPVCPEKAITKDANGFVVIDAERTTRGKTTREQRYYITSLAADAQRLADAIRSHWSVENRLHWCMDVAFGDDQMRARTGHAAHNLAVLKHITLNLIRLDPIPRKGGIKVRRLIAATSDEYREQLFGLRPV